MVERIKYKQMKKRRKEKIKAVLVTAVRVLLFGLMKSDFGKGNIDDINQHVQLMILLLAT